MHGVAPFAFYRSLKTLFGERILTPLCSFGGISMHAHVHMISRHVARQDFTSFLPRQLVKCARQILPYLPKQRLLPEIRHEYDVILTVVS